MTQKEIEEIVGKKLTKGEYSLEKSIYKGILYFFKREIEHDHYFYVPAETKLYVMKHNKQNYDDEITLTGKYPDSFQFNFAGAIDDGRVQDVSTMGGGILTDTEVDYEDFKSNIRTPIDKIKEELDKIILQLVELKSKL